MLDAAGNLYAEHCYYCGEGPRLFFHDTLGQPVCDGCWRAVRDTLGRWGDLRGLAEAGCRKPQGRAVTEADRQVPRGAWTADGKTEKPPAGEGGREGESL